MAIVKNLDNIVKWANEQICSKIKLKQPDDDRNDGAYAEPYINPTTFALYLPAKDRLPPNVPAPIPSICVQLMEGKDSPLEGTGRIKIRLCLAAWNPGNHAGDNYIPKPSPESLGGTSYEKITDPEAMKKFTRNLEGWRDVWNFTDVTLRELENAEYIAGLRLVKEEGITYGPFIEEGVIWDYYPYWHSWISFSLENGLSRKTPDKYKDFL